MTQRPTLVALPLLAIALSLGSAGCADDEGTATSRPSAGSTGAPGAGPDLGRSRDAGGIPIALQLSEGVRLAARARADVVAMARRFATTLAGWLYGDRHAVSVSPIAGRLRRELAHAPPHVPRDQLGSGAGRPVRASVALQTATSGAIAVVIRDPRTTYRIAAAFERRAGRWQIVHLNTH